MKISRDRLFVSTFSANAADVIRKYELGMEINHTCISDDLDDRPDKRENLISGIRLDIEKSGAKRLITHAPYTELYPAAMDHMARALAMMRFNQAYAVSSTVGSSKMVVHSGYVPFVFFKEWQASQSPIFWEEFMQDKPADFKLYIENVLEDEPYMLKDLMKGISDDRIKLCIDTGHANVAAKDVPVYEWIKVLGSSIGHFHIHNNFGGHDNHYSLDKGSLDFHRILSLINDYCPEDATMTVESADCADTVRWLAENGYF